MTVEQPTPPGSHEFVTTLRHFQGCNERLLRELRRQTQAAFTTRHELDDTRRRLDDTRHQLDDTRHQLDGVERALRHVRDSRSYHLLQRVLGPRDGLRRHCLRRLCQVGSVGTRLGLEVKARVAGKTSPAIQPVAAPELPIPSAPAACPHHDHQALYEQWIAVNEPDEAALERQRRTRLARNPLVSLVVPVNRTPLAFLLAMVESVHAQTYPHWELCLADGGSADPILRSVLESYCNQSDRIRVRFLETNRGIAGNTNAALELATGEYVGFLDHDDTLAPFALFEVARALNLYPDADLLYSDEDKIDETGLRRFAPFFKPAWSPDLLRSHNYVCHFAVYRRQLLGELDGIREGFDGAQDHDLVLRVGERTSHIVHIPQVLYHWRDHAASTARRIDAKPEAPAAARRALTEHLHRLGWEGEVTVDRVTMTSQVHLTLPHRPLVSVLIPNKDAHQILDMCLRSLQTAAYENLEILVIENNSAEPETLDYYRGLARDHRIRLLTWPGPFNYAAIHNWAVRQALGEVLLLLNNDVEARHPEWIERMLEHALREDVGGVGAKLFYPDGTIQHAGITVGLSGRAGHTHWRCPGEAYGENSRLRVIANQSAVTGACLMLRKVIFDAVGGFDERFAVAYNDVDLCMKIRQLDKVIVWTPFAQLWHHESWTRGPEDTPAKYIRWAREAQLFGEKWAEVLAAGDPYYNPNLSLASDSFLPDPVGARPPHPRGRNVTISWNAAERRAA